MPETHPGIYRTDISSKVSRKPFIQENAQWAVHFLTSSISLFPIWIKMSSFYVMQLL